MPSFRAVVDCRFSAGSGGGTNTWHFRTDEPLGVEDEVSSIMGWVQTFYASVAALFPQSYTWSWDGQITEILTAEPTFSPARTGWEEVGGSSSDVYGAAAGMACVTWRTELASRSGRGRTFLGPLAASAVQADGSLNTSALDLLRTSAGALVGQSNTNDGVGAIGVYSPTDSLIRDVVGATVTDQVAILRSRRD